MRGTRDNDASIHAMDHFRDVPRRGCFRQAPSRAPSAQGTEPDQWEIVCNKEFAAEVVLRSTSGPRHAYGSRLTLLGSVGEFLQPTALLLGGREFHAQLGNNQCLLDGWLIRRRQLQLEDMRSVVSSGLSVGQNQALD